MQASTLMHIDAKSELEMDNSRRTRVKVNNNVD